MEIIDYKCKKCGNEKSYKQILDNLEYGKCTQCGAITYTITQQKQLVRCPYCNSYKVQKISTMSKIGSVAIFGVFAVGKVAKEWHCNDCKSDF